MHPNYKSFTTDSGVIFAWNIQLLQVCGYLSMHNIQILLLILNNQLEGRIFISHLTAIPLSMTRPTRIISILKWLGCDAAARIYLPKTERMWQTVVKMLDGIHTLISCFKYLFQFPLIELFLQQLLLPLTPLHCHRFQICHSQLTQELWHLQDLKTSLGKRNIYYRYCCFIMKKLLHTAGLFG